MAKSKKDKVPARHVVVISRHWDNPEVNISVTDTLIAVAMKLPLFLNAVSDEMDLSADEKKELLDAASTVCSKMKSETTKVM